MKNASKLLLALTLVFSMFFANESRAHYIWLDPDGLITATPGDSVSVDVYLHADVADGLQMWSMSLGFDDTAVDGAELTYQSITYGATVLGAGLGIESYDPGDSVNDPGESRIIDISRAGAPPNWATEGLTAGQDFLLFTANFTFDGGIWDGEDVWVEWNTGNDGFGFDSGWNNTLDAVYSDDDGPDYAAVPVPAAVWLLGSGLLGLTGLRRRNR